MKKPKEALLFRFSVLLDTEGKIVIEEDNTKGTQELACTAGVCELVDI